MSVMSPFSVTGSAALGAGTEGEPAAPGGLVCAGLLCAQAPGLCPCGAGLQPLCSAGAGQRRCVEQPGRHPPAGARV